MHRRRETLPKQHQKPNTIHKQTNNINNPNPSIFFPDRRNSRQEHVSRREEINPPVGDRAPGLGPPGKAMTHCHGEKDPAPRVQGNNPQGGLLPGSMGEAAPSLRGRETLAIGDKSTLPIGRGDKIVFLDFGRSKIFAITDDSDEVLVFNNIAELAEKLRPTVIVLDRLPGKLQNTAAELAKTGIIFLRLKNLKKLSEERKNNGLKKSDENDVVALRTLFRRNLENFQPLFLTPEELTVRALTELWAQMTSLKKNSKQARTATDNQLAVEIHRTQKRIVERLSEEIHGEALKLPLYRLTNEKLGLRGPTLAYILSHDGWALKTLNSDKLQVRYQLVPLKRHRSKRSRLLITLANTAVLNNHPRYRPIFEKYMERFQGQKYAYWKAILRVARRILRDIRLLANGQEPWTPTG